jgi:lipoprotein-anchoring transpeptidase ErfK/SrfK
MRRFLLLLLSSSSLLAQVPTDAPPQAPAEPQIMRAEPVRERELITRLQIYLDQRNFGPGKIDGRWGEFTGKALNRSQKASGMVVDGKWESLPDLLQISPIYTTYVLRPQDFRQLGEIPKTPKEQSTLKRMPYTSILEFLGEKFHSDPNFIQQLNKRVNFDGLKAGDEIRVPNVAPFIIEDMKEIGSVPPVPEHATRSIHVDTVNKMLELRDGEKLLAAFPITPGAANHPAPKGKWRIVGIATMPWYRWNKGVLKTGVASGESYDVPAGPNCQVCVLWCGLNKRGVGIHGTNSPDNIGRTGSHGCIRLANWDAARFVHMVSKGMTVHIDAVDAAPTVAATPTPAAAPSPAPEQ